MEAERRYPGTSGSTICASFLETVGRHPNETALRWFDEHGWRTLTWEGYREAVARAASGLRALGVSAGERVAMLIRNRAEFHFIDLATLFLGAVPVSIYNSSSPEQIERFLSHCEASVLVVENADLLTRAEKSLDGLLALRRVVMVDVEDGPQWTTPLARILAADPLDIAEACRTIQPADLVTVIYTSGTTGDPKGVMLSHRNVLSAVHAFIEVQGRSLYGLRQLSYLPMAHIAERLATHYFHVVEGSIVTTCPDISQVPRYTLQVRPEWWAAPPRSWEALRAGIDANLADDTDMRNRFEAARALGAEVLASGRSVGRGLPAELAERWGKAQQEVIRPVLARFGLDEVKIAMTGSAAMAQSTAEFFLHCGIPLSDLYGQSETSGLVSWDPNEITPGTSGKPLPGVKVTLADDGEILVRGDNVFVGYLNDESSTSEVMDGAGWLHTGDLGRIDEEGNLVLVGRKKDLLVPSNGHNVSPAPIEAALKECLLIGQACVIGDARPYLVALVVLDPQAVTSWAQRFGFHESTLTELSEEPALIGALEQHVKETNRRFAPAERIREFVMLAEQWPLDSELLTPTGKLKRRGILLRYEDLIAEMYRR